MSDIKMPSFNFKSSFSEADVVKDATSGAKEQKVFQPGTYDLKVLTAEYHQQMSDQTWSGYKLSLGIDTRSIRTYVSVPTSSPLYSRPGAKPTMFLFHKFRDFLRGLGEDASVDNLNKTIQKLFADPSKLVGKVLKVTIGYKGPHSVYVEKGVYKLVDKDGKEVVPNTFPDRDSVKAFAAVNGTLLEDFPEILKVHVKEAVKKEEETNAWGE